MSYIKNVLIGFDQFVNTICNGDPDETLSSRAHRLTIERGRPWPERFINVLFLLFLDFNHCKGAYESELLRKQFPETLRPSAFLNREEFQRFQPKCRIQDAL